MAPSELNWVAPYARISSQKRVAENRADSANVPSAQRAAAQEYHIALT